MRYLDGNGNRIELGQQLGAGGEGSVYELASLPDCVAKLYHRPLNAAHVRKLNAMLAVSSSALRQATAWPTSLVIDRSNGAVVGIVMPKVGDRRAIHELYGPAHRMQNFPNADWAFLIRVARNCARAFSILHDCGIILGDVNQSNVLVADNATVRLIDCDSFQIQSHGETFGCHVGVPHFTPPELQGRRLTDVTRTINHDNFGLAVLIFHLLFMGRHPFAGVFSGRGDMPIERAIKEYRFPYSNRAASYEMGPPPHTLTLMHLPCEVAQLFEAAFARGSDAAGARPAPKLWDERLEQLESLLASCMNHPLHRYPNHLPACPWCSITQNGGPHFFVAVAAPPIGGPAFDLTAIWSQITSMRSPDQAFRRAPRASITALRPRPLPAVCSAHIRSQQVRGWIAVCCGIAFLPAATVSSPLAICCLIASAIVLSVRLLAALGGPLRSERKNRAEACQRASRDVEQKEAALNSVMLHCRSRFQEKRQALDKLKEEYDSIPSKRKAEVARLQQEARKLQLEVYLRKFLISDGQIRGIGPSRISALRSFGIETAGDIEYWKVRRVPGFGDVFTNTLCDWRRKLEVTFRFNPNAGVPQSAIQAIDNRYAQSQAHCERKIVQGMQKLIDIAQKGKEAIESRDRDLAAAELRRMQAEVDLKLCR